MTDSSLLFVYGTLMSGQCRHHHIQNYVDFLGERSVQGTLVHLGAYPGLLLEGHGRVFGELYSVVDPDKLWPLLDGVEGSEYERKLVDVGGAMAWTYVLAQTGDWPVIASGRWLERLPNAPERA